MKTRRWLQRDEHFTRIDAEGTQERADARYEQIGLHFWRFLALERVCKRGPSRAAKGWRAAT